MLCKYYGKKRLIKEYHISDTHRLNSKFSNIFLKNIMGLENRRGGIKEPLTQIN